MQQLINITTDPQGGSVVSARELYTFLEVKARFNDWFKRRVIKYGFQQDVDFVEIKAVLLKSEYNPGGRPQTDYALTLDMAKQLSMVENNQRGKQARRYFIDCKRAARTLPVQPQPSTETLPTRSEQAVLHLVSQQAQLLSNQQAIIDQLRADVNKIRLGSKFSRLSSAPALLSQGMPEETLRPLINRTVNDYCDLYGAQQGEVYNYLYKRFFETYGINPYRLPRAARETILDGLERHGHLRRLYELTEHEFRLLNSQHNRNK